MDRRRAAGALLALAACIATTAAAPTASNHTALDLYDEHTEGCYYNFQHYGEGDRIMTNEPCLNCTCHNRMLMCYLRVCPFTKAIGQDCTVEKRADQCCPIVTCPDVPVDLLTSTSTSSPAEYGGTGVGKVDNYGCTLNGKYFPEGSKVPGTPNKPCEHCYCIRNMTTCVMQECTLHVDGCTPIYHKDVCCPVRYFCDHPEDEIPLLDDMTTTVRPTPGFTLSPITTEIPTTLQPARKDCVENGQLYEDGALIKTDKPCEHCYCMKGDIVCVVQECGTPMENEGKNCTSVPPRAGHCCPDTYICEGDEFNPEPTTELPFEESTTMLPSRRVSVEGSGYRNDDEITLMPTFATDVEGSGEEELPERPLSTSQPAIETTELDDKLGLTEQGEFIPKSTQAPVSDVTAQLTTEPDKDLNTVPSDFDGESTESSVKEKTTLPDQAKVTESTVGEEITTPRVIAEASGAPETDATPEIEIKPTDSTLPQEQSTSVTPKLEEESTVSSVKETTPKSEEKITELPVVHEDATQVPPVEPAITEKTESSTVMDGFKATEQPPVTKQQQEATTPRQIVEEESSEPSVATSPSEESEGEVTETDLKETRRTSAKDEETTEKISAVEQEYTPSQVTEEIRTEPTVLESTTPRDKLDVTEPAVISEQSTVSEKESTEPSVYDKTTVSEFAETPIITQQETVTSAIPEEESSEPSILEKTTARTDLETTKLPIPEEEQPDKVETSTEVPKVEEDAVTTESAFRQGDESSTPTESATHKDADMPTTVEMDVTKEIVTPGSEISSSEAPTRQPVEHEPELTTTHIPEQQEKEKTTQLIETTTEPIMELSTFAHVDDKEPPSSISPESEIVPTTSATEKQDIPEATTINPEDNEIDEEQSPGRIPGEGDCLLEGVTYKNDSVVPSSNKCHSGCKCVSSIIKCDPIICSPQPEYMDNCQLRYDTPESCCPTYVCDHGKETIPPQPHSQMSGTESPMQSTAVECSGDQCGATDEQQPTTEASKIPERTGDTECGSNGCDDTQSTLPQAPAECIGDKCTQPAESCTEGKCDLPSPPAKEQPQEIPSKEISEKCDNPEDCKSIQVPTPCDNESCTTTQEQACDKEGGCETPSVSPCEGEHCEVKPAIAPDAAAPETAAPGTVAPETVAPSTVVPGSATPETIAPETVAPDAAAPETVAPGTVAPDTVAPETIAPHTVEPDTVAPETVAPHTFEPYTVAPDAAAPETVAPETVKPDKDTTVCENQEDCKYIKEVQPPCEGDSCAVEPESTTSKSIPQPCENEEECKRVEIPVTATEVKEDCSTGDCKITTSPVSEDKLCAGQDDCRTPEKPSTDCKDGTCADRESEDKIVPVCAGDECMQQEPVSPTQATAYSEPLSTEAPGSEQTTSSSFVTKEEEKHTALPETSTSEVTPEPEVTDKPEKHIPEHETTVADEEDKVTKAPMVEITTAIPDLTSEGSGEPIDKEEEVKKDVTTEIPATEPTQENVGTTRKPEDKSTDRFGSPVTEPQQETETKPISTETESPQQVTESQEKQTEKPEEPSTELPKEGHDETPTEIPDVLVTKTEETTEETEVHKIGEDRATTASGVPVTDYEKATEEPKPVETSTSEIERTETTEKLSDLSKSTEASTETGVGLTESPIYEAPETETKQPDIVIEIGTEKQEISTKSPLEYGSQETTTSFERAPDQEIPVVEQEKTETSTVEVTTAHEPETTEEIPAKVPERSDDKKEDSAETTMIPELEQTETKVPVILDTTETITQKSDESDVQTTASIPTEEKTPQSHVTEPQTERVTEIALTTTPQTTEDLDTTAPDTAIEDKNETESPLSHVTEKEQTGVTTPQAPVSEDVTQPERDHIEVEVTTEKSELHEPEQMVTELPPFPTSEPEKKITEAPHSLVTEQDTGLEKETEIIPEKEPEDTDKQEPITVTPAPTVAVPVEHIATDQHEASTKAPFITEVTSPTEEKVTESSYETESPSVQAHDETTSAPMLQSTPEKEITIDVKQPSITEEYEISTEGPKQPGEDEYTPTKQQEIVTEAPEVLINTDVMPSELPTGIPPMPEDEKDTTKPEDETTVDSGDKISEATEGPKLETEIPVSSTEPHGITEPTVIEKDTTIPEQEPTTVLPIEFATKEILREGPETAKEGEISTEPTGLFSTESPQIQETETRKDEIPTTIIPESPSKETYTESSAAVETSEPDKPAVVTTERSEISTTVSETEHEETETEQAEKVTEPSQEPSTEKSEVTEMGPEILVTKEQESTEPAPVQSPETTESPVEISTKLAIPESPEHTEIVPQETISTPKPEIYHSETTPYLVELEEHTHKIDEELSTISPSEEPTTSRIEEGSEEPHVTGGSTEAVPSDEKQTQVPPVERDQPEKEETPASTESPQSTPASPEEAPERTTEPSILDSETTPGVISPIPTEEHTLEDKYGVTEQEKEQESTTPTEIPEEKEPITTAPSVEKEKPVDEIPAVPEKDTTEKPQDVPVDITAPEEEFIPVTTTTKITTAKVEEETATQSAEPLDKFTKPEEKPSETVSSTSAPEVSKPDELPPTDEALPPEEEHFPPSGMGGYNQEPDYGEEDQAFGPGTCRYGGKVYVSAQQIPRDDPCDFCFCFRSDIICLQQSCPPPIHGCHEEPIQGFCCPRYECPVSMATTLNVTTTTTTTTTTLPPHFLPHAYKGAAQRRGCQIKGHTYKVGEVVRASSGPCLHCTCGGDGQMKCDPKACTPEPMLRQMIAAAVSAKRRR